MRQKPFMGAARPFAAGPQLNSHCHCIVVLSTLHKVTVFVTFPHPGGGRFGVGDEGKSGIIKDVSRVPSPTVGAAQVVGLHGGKHLATIQTISLRHVALLTGLVQESQLNICIMLIRTSF